MEKVSHNNLPAALELVLSELAELKQILSEKSLTVAAPVANPLLTIQEASKLLNLSISTIYGLVSRAAIPHSKKGKRLYFNSQDLLDWVKTGRRKTTAEVQAAAANVPTYKSR